MKEKLGVKRSEDISCPNFFKLGDKWVSCALVTIRCALFHWRFVNRQFLPEYHAVLGGNGNQYFAPESLETPDGRRVNWSWYRGDKYLKSIQSLPTQMEQADGIIVYVLRELEQLRCNEK